MAPLPENNTAVYFVDYAFNDQQRTMQFRQQPGASLGDLTFTISAFLEALEPILCTGWVVTGARYRAALADFSLPVEFPTVVTPGCGPLLAENNPRFYTFTGRGLTSGRRVRVHVYGLTLGVPADYRRSPGENAALDAARTVLDVDGDGIFGTIAGDNPQWYLYYNTGYNSYHERQARK